MDFLDWFGLREGEIVRKDQAGPEGSEDSTVLAAENNDFAVTLYREMMRTAAEGNFVFSPFSIRLALAMARAGAAGTTAREMDEALRISSPDGAGPEVFQKVLDRYRNPKDPRLSEIAVANSIWLQSGMALREGYREAASRCYGATIHTVDFVEAPEEASQAINNWIAQQTRGRIKHLASPATQDPTRKALVLANAVYFKSEWSWMFQSSETRIGDYFPGKGAKVRVPFMRQTASMRYVRRTSYQAIELDFMCREFSFLVILPDERDGLPALENKLTATEILECVQQMRYCRIKLSLPSFTFSSESTGLQENLSALGMRCAFDRDHADFSGINGRRPPDEQSLSIGTMLHSAFIEVNEAGVEAAAATAMEALWRGTETPTFQRFRADHPFLFAIRDARDGTILFLGRVWNPHSGTDSGPGRWLTRLQALWRRD